MDGTDYEWNPKNGRPKLSGIGPFASEMQDRQRDIAEQEQLRTTTIEVFTHTDGTDDIHAVRLYEVARNRT